MSDCVFVPHWPELPNQFGALSTLRAGGFSLTPYDDGLGAGGFNLASHVGDDSANVQKNRSLLANFLPCDPVWLNQVHGTAVAELGRTQHHLTADACFTPIPGVVCAVQTADCLPVLFCDAKTNVVAASHAGWRGLVSGVLEKTLEHMCRAGAAPGDILVWLGPAIGPRQFEVGSEVRDQFIQDDSCALAAFVQREKKPGKFYADIYQLARLRLQKAGVNHISGGNFCTVTQREKFYSYRRDGVTGRMASLIWIKP
jgi:YfiH family protein